MTFGFVPPIPLAPPLPLKPVGTNPIDTIPLNPLDPWYPWPWGPGPSPEPQPDNTAPIPTNPNADPLGYPDIPPESIPFPANPDDPDTAVRWEVDFSVTSINISRPSCVDGADPSFGETTVYSDTLHTYSRAITVVTRQGLLDSLGCDQPETGFGDAPSDFAVKVNGDDGEVVSELSSLSRNTLSNFYQPGRLVTYVTTIDAVRREDDTQPLPDFLPNPDQPKKPVPLPIIPEPLVPFPDPEFIPPAPEPEPAPAPAPPIPSPDNPTAPPFTPPKAPPAKPQTVPDKKPDILPLPLPIDPGQVPIPEPIPEIPPSPEPAPDPNIVPAPSPQPLPAPVPNPLPNPQPFPLPGPVPNPTPQPGEDPEPGPAPIPTPGEPEPAVTPDLLPGLLPAARWPLPYWWPFNRPKNNIRPFTPPTHHFPTPGGPPVTPGGARPTPDAIANELGRVEQKNNQQLINFGNMLQILELLQEALEDFFAPVVPADEWTLRGICETVPEGEAQPYHKWEFPESPKVDAIGLRVDALAEMLQVHLSYKTPTCGTERPQLEGVFRTISFRSDETSPYGKSRLRKRFRYRSSSGLGLGEVVDHWKDFTYAAGPVCVIHSGSSWGTPQVWAATADEGKRVIQHAAREAGIDPDQVGKWTISGSDNPRIGVPGQMRVDTTGGYYWITARDGSDGRPIVARRSNP